eukprot:g7082.t1
MRLGSVGERSALVRQLLEQRAHGSLKDCTNQERFTGMSLKSFGMTSSMPGTSGAPRKAKERKDGRSMELMDLAFSQRMTVVDGQVMEHYTPISLPYFTVEEEDSYFLMQLPCVLPEMRNPDDEVFREQEDALSAGSGSTITRLPDGKLGKLRIYKSGKVRMEIGGVSFCVDQGCETFFQQDRISEWRLRIHPSAELSGLGALKAEGGKVYQALHRAAHQIAELRAEHRSVHSPLKRNVKELSLIEACLEAGSLA